MISIASGLFWRNEISQTARIQDNKLRDESVNRSPEQRKFLQWIRERLVNVALPRADTGSSDAKRFCSPINEQVVIRKESAGCSADVKFMFAPSIRVFIGNELFHYSIRVNVRQMSTCICPDRELTNKRGYEHRGILKNSMFGKATPARFEAQEKNFGMDDSNVQYPIYMSMLGFMVSGLKR